ncbi:GNAT family N-acetyltransferase [Amycolatopsis sp. PS_44_ISF1]|uniref:GNAT family N-acetyltransferase n=1 Tax=Amycolatopsis sp. PS_44_ISF1 TaxID=2974917 RepID=UPI0028DF0469|nr:GNAT family N-acetyltransferase [Amycolatopsis sp. PS_44_ISF1]MDT8911709.1 GNAT family N-acetyltransferase [Amycolatopsis sp. PS_44_ISF1]
MLTEIKTERLLLRPFREADRPEMVAIETDPRTNRYRVNPPDGPAAEHRFDTWLEHWRDHGYGYLAVFGPESPALLGLSGVRSRDFDGGKVLNLGYRFHPSAWGRGYAVEAASASVDWAERELAPTPVLISVNVVNQPSLRVVERLGFTRYEETEEGDGAVVRHYRR